MEINQLKNLLKDFGENVRYEEDIKKKTGLILVEKQKPFLRFVI